ncbi:hypothetical protein [Aliivibrio salmonicida]|uniref:hypothetical protein n=1 Tax=Aliivibrio salmonicida TaxID=40269 RepID=UPI003D11EFE7
MSKLKKSNVDKAIQRTLPPSYRALHWHRDTNGNVIKTFMPLKPYQTLQRYPPFE